METTTTRLQDTLDALLRGIIAEAEAGSAKKSRILAEAYATLVQCSPCQIHGDALRDVDAEWPDTHI